MLEKIADMALQYRGESIWVPDTKFGDYIGAGDGTLTGTGTDGTPSGRVKWTLFENQRPDVCDFSLVGTITGEDGTEHPFEVLGFSQHEPDSRTWRLSGGIRFPNVEKEGAGSAAAGYPPTAVITGVFRSEGQSHHYEIFRQLPDG